MTEVPRLSIGVPVYNGERFLSGLFENLARQTFRDFEIVVSDNASTDRTADICREWMRRDPRIRYHCNPCNIGSAGNFNRVFELSRAPLFKWAACDDTYDPQFLEACVNILDSRPDVILAQTDVICVDDRGVPFERDFTTGSFIIPGTTFRYAVDPIDVGESRFAARRYYDMLFRCRSNAQIFGVMRRDALAATGGLPNFLGSEKTTVLELSLLGRFAQDRRPLFNRCYHPNITEAKGNDEGKSYIAAGKTRYSRPIRMLRAFLSTPFGKPILPVTWVACYGLLALRGVQFAARSLFQNEAKNWPFRAAWGNRNDTRSSTTL